jgi:hypothetical protein
LERCTLALCDPFEGQLERRSLPPAYMYSMHRKVVLWLILGSLACDGGPTRPRVDPTACTSVNDEQTFACARLDAQILYDGGRPVAFAFLTLASPADTVRYRLTAGATDSTGHIVVEVRRRRVETLDTATVALLVTTPPASQPGGLGQFYCATLVARLHFGALGTVPDTLRATWTLATLASRTDHCAATTTLMRRARSGAVRSPPIIDPGTTVGFDYTTPAV